MTAQVRSAYSHTLNSCGWCSWWLSAKKPVGFYWTKLRSTTCSHARWSWLPWGKAFHYLQHLRFCLWCFWMVMVKIMRVCLTAFQHRPRLRSRGDKNVLPSRQDWEGSKFLQTLQSWSCRWIVFTLVFFCDFMRTFFDWFIVGSKSSSLLVWVLQEWLWCTKLFRKSLSSSMSWGQTSQKHQWSWFCHSFWWESKKKTIKIKIISCGTAGWLIAPWIWFWLLDVFSLQKSSLMIAAISALQMVDPGQSPVWWTSLRMYVSRLGWPSAVPGTVEMHAMVGRKCLDLAEAQV